MSVRHRRLSEAPRLPADRVRAGPSLTAPALYRAVLLAALLVVAGLLFEQLVTLALLTVITVIVAIPLALVNSRLAGALYVLVAIIWVVPDRRMERTLAR